MNENKLYFSAKVGKSHKNHGWSITRGSTLDLIPELPYETGCNIVVDGIPAKAHFNIQPRIFYNNDEKVLIDYLKSLAEKNPNDRVKIEMLLDYEIKCEKDEIDRLMIDIEQLKYINENKSREIDKLKDYLIILKKENEELHKEILLQNQNNKKLSKKLEKVYEILDESV